MVRLRHRRIEPGHDGIAHELVYRAFLREHGFGHGSKVTVQNENQFFRRKAFAVACKSADVCEQHGDVHAFAAKLQAVRVKLFDDGGGDHAFKEATLRFQLLSFCEVVEDNCHALSFLSRILKWREIQAPVYIAAFGEEMTDFKVYDGFVCIADLRQMRTQLTRNRSKRLVKIMTDDVN